MRDIAFVFLLAAGLCVKAGMLWGIRMAISQDNLLAPTHADLNLVGWTTLALFGSNYRLTPQAAQGLLPRLHAVLSIAGVVLIVPGIALAVTGGTPAIATVWSLLTLGSMLSFLFTVLRPRSAAVRKERRAHSQTRRRHLTRCRPAMLYAQSRGSAGVQADGSQSGTLSRIDPTCLPRRRETRGQCWPPAPSP